MHSMLLTTHIRRPLARLVAHMMQESPQQTTQTPGPLRTRAVKSCYQTSPAEPPSGWYPRTTRLTNTSVLSILRFSMPGTLRPTPGIILIPRASFQMPCGISSVSSPSSLPADKSDILSSLSFYRSISPISYHLFPFSGR